MIVVYGKPGCGGCDNAKMWLKMQGVKFQYLDITKDTGAMEFLMEGGYSSVPQIFRNGVHLGGYKELRAMKGEDIIG